MTALEAWLVAHPALVAIMLPIVIPLWSGALHALGSKLGAAGWPKAASVLHFLATRSPPTSKAEAAQLAKDAAEVAKP